MRFTIFGAGSLGTIVAALLVRGGHQVRVIARGKRADYIRKNGLKVNGLIKLTEPCEVFEKVEPDMDSDVLIFCVKTYQMQQAMEATNRLAPNVVFSLANGLKKNEQLKSQFPQSKILGCMANFSGELLECGLVNFTRNVSFNIDGNCDEGKTIAKTLSLTGLKSIADERIDATEWSKFTGWISLFALSILTRSPIGQFLSTDEFARQAYFLIREVALLAEKSGVTLHDDTVLPVHTISRSKQDGAVSKLLAIGEEFRVHFPNHKISALQDLENKKPLELHETLGHVVEMAAKLAVILTVSPIYYQLIAGLDVMNRRC